MDSLFRAYAIEALRCGDMDPVTVNGAADEAEAVGDGDTAHQLRMLIIEADGTRPTERAAEQRRASIRVVADGGNSQG